MIINGGSRCNWRFFSKHLMREDHNERVSVTEIRGFAADTIKDAFQELDALASGTRAKNFFYHANINTRADEVLTPEQWNKAIDELESNLGLEGQSRFVVEHVKEGRTHRHVIWSRIDPDTMTVISDSHNFAKHEQTARALEAEFGHEAVQGVHSRDKETTKRPDRAPKDWETFRGSDTGITPAEVKAKITELWHQCDSGQAFAAALDEHGFMLAIGDRPCIVDLAGDIHSLARRINGVRVAEISERLADIMDELPTVAEASELMKARADNEAPADRDQKEVTAETLTPFEQFKEGVKEIMAANNGDLVPYSHAGLDAEKQDGGAPATRFQRFVHTIKAIMHDESGLPHAHYALGGFSWWERAAMLVAPIAAHAVIEKAIETAQDYWQNLVDRHKSVGDSEQREIDRDR